MYKRGFFKIKSILRQDCFRKKKEKKKKTID